MTICYDLSAAAQAAAHPGGATGVPRVVEKVLRELVADRRPGELRLCAPSSPVAGWEYFQREFAASGALFLHGRTGNSLGRALRRVTRYARVHRDRRRLTDRLTRALLQRAAVPYLGRLDARGLASADVYHSPHGAIPAEVRRHRQLRVCLTVYDLIPFRRPEFFVPGMAEAQRRILRTARVAEDRFLCISEHTKTDLCELFGVDPARAFVTPLAADPGTFYPVPDGEARRAVLRRYGLGEGSYALSVCTLEPRKNLRTVLRAFRALLEQEKFPDLRLVLVGGRGWLDGPLRAELDCLGEWRDRVLLPGYVPDGDLAALYSGALCFVYMSFYEGFGLPPLEAMQCGVPVVTSNASSLPEVVGDAGVCLDPTDETGLAHAIGELHRSAGRRERMASRSLARAAGFSWRRCLDATLAAYASA